MIFTHIHIHVACWHMHVACRHVHFACRHICMLHIGICNKSYAFWHISHPIHRQAIATNKWSAPQEHVHWTHCQTRYLFVDKTTRKRSSQKGLEMVMKPLNALKHESFDEPPNKTFFGKEKGASGTVSSPGKRIQLRTDQLTKWAKLKHNFCWRIPRNAFYHHEEVLTVTLTSFITWYQKTQ